MICVELRASLSTFWRLSHGVRNLWTALTDSYSLPGGVPSAVCWLDGAEEHGLALALTFSETGGVSSVVRRVELIIIAMSPWRAVSTARARTGKKILLICIITIELTSSVSMQFMTPCRASGTSHAWWNFPEKTYMLYQSPLIIYFYLLQLCI